MLLADGETTTLLLTMLVKAVADLVMMQISKAQHAVLFILLIDTILIIKRLKDPFLSPGGRQKAFLSRFNNNVQWWRLEMVCDNRH